VWVGGGEVVAATVWGGWGGFDTCSGVLYPLPLYAHVRAADRWTRFGIDLTGPCVAWRGGGCRGRVGETMHRPADGGSSAPALVAEPAGGPCSTSFVFIIEGEGENGSTGFQETLLANLGWFDETTVIMNNNRRVRVWMLGCSG
jgi:hypothetical protein